MDSIWSDLVNIFKDESCPVKPVDLLSSELVLLCILLRQRRKHCLSSPFRLAFFFLIYNAHTCCLNFWFR